MTLSKSQYLRGLQCVKALWLQRNRKDLIPPVEPSLQMIFDQGAEVGELARRRFPEGRLIAQAPSHLERALEETKVAAQTGPGALFEAAVRFYDVLVRPDILARNKDGSWDVIEVKSSSEAKEEHLHDLAVQRYVLEGAGFPVRKAWLWHVDGDYVRRGQVDPEAFFRAVDLTSATADLLDLVTANVAEFHRVAALKAAPDIDIGPHCSKPYECVFRGHCWKDIPEYSIYNLSRVSAKKLELLKERGIARVRDIPDDFPLSPSQRLQVQVEKAGLEFVEVKAVAELLSALEYPLHFLDFETVNPAIPPYEGMRPFQQLTFQVSVHVQREADGPVEHVEFLGDGRSDPRSGLVDRLLGAIGPRGSVVVYNAAFERHCLEGLAESQLRRASELLSIKERLWDLADPFKGGFYVHPGFQGSWSIKAVLPALVPTMSYEGLAVSDGSQAQEAYLRLMRGKLSSGAAQELARALKSYCAQDTMGMVELLARLRARVNA